MASEVDICNLALSHLGDTATIASLDPPEGSAQAEHCARFYPIARDALLEMHSWGFATQRVQLAQLGGGWPEWDYAYAVPPGTVNVIAVLPPDATDDYSQSGYASSSLTGFSSGVPESAGGQYVPQPFSCEVDEAGRQVIYTDQPNAVLRYSTIVTDTTRFSPLFVATLSHMLASYLAGPILKGDVGRAEAAQQLKFAQSYLSQAKESDSSQRRVRPDHVVSWMAGR